MLNVVLLSLILVSVVAVRVGAAVVVAWLFVILTGVNQLCGTDVYAVFIAVALLSGFFNFGK